jgi:hypothetical protein
MVSLFMVGTSGPNHVGVVSHAEAAEITGSFYGVMARWESRDPETQEVLNTFPDGHAASRWFQRG